MIEVVCTNEYRSQILTKSIILIAKNILTNSTYVVMIMDEIYHH